MTKSFWFWTIIASYFLRRSGRSTAALSLMVLSAIAVLIFLSALAVGINDAMVRNSVSLYTGHITGYNLPLSITPPQLQEKGVMAVLQRFHTSGILLSTDRMITTQLIGVEPAAERRATALWRKTVAGDYLEEHQRSLFLSSAVADRLNVTPGDTVHFKADLAAPEVPFTISGTYRTGVEQVDQEMVFCPIDVFPGQAVIWSAAIFLQEGTDPAAIADRFRDLFGHDGKFRTWSELMPDLRQLIDLNYVSMSIVIVLVFGVVSLGISCAFVIFIVKNLREYGIMKSMGVSPGETMFLIIAEVVLMNLAASCIGMMLGVGVTVLINHVGIDLSAFTSHNRYFAVSGVIYPRLTAFSVGAPPALALFSSVAAAFWPALLVIHKKAADVLRSM